MKKLIFSLVILFFTSNFYAQTDEGESSIPLKVKLSEVHKDKKKYTSLSFSTKDGKGGVILGRRHKKGYYIEHYNENQKLLTMYDFEVKKRKGYILPATIDAAFMSDGKLCLIEYLYNKKTKTVEYYANLSNLGHFSFTRNKIMSVPIKKTQNTKFISFSNTYDGSTLGNVILSKNQKYFSISIEIKDEENFEKQNIYVFDNSLNKVYQTVFKRNLKDRKFVTQNIDISENDGSVLILGKAFTKAKKKKKDGGKYQYELYKLSKDGQKKIIFDSKDKYIGSLNTNIKNDKISCIGFYSERNDNRYKGLVYFKINKDNMSIESSNYSPFTNQFIQDKYGKNKQKELKNIDVKSIHINDNNETILNAEEFYITSHYVSSPNGGGHTTYTYHYNDIISAKLDANGKLIWARNINKKQISRYFSPYNSFTATFYNNKVYFFINCSDKIRKLRGNRLLFKGKSAKRSNLYVITLNQKGDFEYQKVLDDKDSVPIMVGQGIINNNGKDVIFTGRKGSKKQALKITIPN